MKFIRSIELYLSTIKERDFYKYSIIVLGSFILICSFLVYRYYRSIGALQQNIARVNNYREEMRDLLTEFARIEQQKAAVDAMLDREPNFKIGGYFNALFDELQLTNNKLEDTISHTTRHNIYRETRYRVRLAGISMRQLSELLDRVERNDRLSVIELEVTKSKKEPGTIEAIVTASTLQRQSEPAT